MKKIAAGFVLLALLAFGTNTAKAVSISDLQQTVSSLQQQVSSMQAQLGLVNAALQTANASSNYSAAATSQGTSTAVTSNSATTMDSSTATPNPAMNSAVNPAPSAYATSNVTSNSGMVSPSATIGNTAYVSSTLAPAALGSTGANVTAIQNILIEKGYLKTSATGYYGAQTQAAVTALQASLGLPTVGRVGPQTISALSSSSLATLSAGSLMTGTPCGVGSSPFVQVLAPNGGESFGLTSTIHATWSSCSQPNTGALGMALVEQATGYNIYVTPSVAPAFNLGHYDIAIPSGITLGAYKLRVYCQTPGSEAYCIDRAHSEDLSDATFMITSGSPTSGSGLLIARNMAYPDQTVSPGTTHFKVGSYLITNLSSTETVHLTNFNIGFTGLTSSTTGEVSNISATINSVVAGATVATLPSTAVTNIAVSRTLAPSEMVTVDLFADVGTLPVPSFRSNLMVSGIGSSGASYITWSGSSYSGQAIYIGSTAPLCTITAFTAMPTTVASGGSSTLSFSTAGCINSLITGGTGSFTTTTVPSGTVSTGPLTATTTYILTAHGASGSTVSASVTVAVTASTCAITYFTASPSTVVSGGSTMLSWSTTGCLDATVVSSTGGSATTTVSTALSASLVSSGPIYLTTTYTLTAHSAGSVIPVTASLTVPVSASGGLFLSRNAAYSDQTISPGTMHEKIASYIAQNTSSETITANLIHVSPTFGSLPVSDLTNLSITMNGVPVGTSFSVPTADNHTTFSFPILAGSSATVDVYADVGPAPFGTIITAALLSGNGAVTGMVYPSVATASTISQTITVTSGGVCSLLPTFVSAASSVSQYVATGTTTGATDATQATFKLTAPTATTLTELKLSVAGPSTATSARIGTSTAMFVSGTAYFTSLSIAVPAGGAGVNVTVYLSYPPVGPAGLASGTLSTATLTYLKFVCGGTTSMLSTSISAPTMNLVASKPVVAVANPIGSLLSVGNVEVIDVTVSADSHGDIALGGFPLTITGTGFTGNYGISTIVVKNAATGAVIPTVNAAYTSGYSTMVSFMGTGRIIPAGSSETYKVYIPITAVSAPAPTALLNASVADTTGLYFEWKDVTATTSFAPYGTTYMYNYPSAFVSSIHN